MTHMIMKEAIIAKEQQGLRVDVVLAALFPDYSRTQLSSWLKTGAITLDKRVYKPKDKVQGGELVRLEGHHIIKSGPSLPEAIPLSLIYEDEHLLIVNKPAGLVVHPGAGNQTQTLVNALLHHDSALAHLPRAGIIHRLDKNTTGLLIVAKTIKAHTSLTRQMQSHDIQRQYLALVQGHVIAGGVVDTFFGRHPHHRLKMAVCKQGKQAITHYRVRKHYHYVTLLEVKLMTGRTHQIRVHMAHLGHPVIGDALYGGSKSVKSGLSKLLRDILTTFPRQALHAWNLTFKHPETQNTLTFTATLPDDFQQLLSNLDAENVLSHR